jgi:hypothetical protein
MTYEAAVLGDSPVLLWMLDETFGTIAADATGNGNDGTYSQSAPGGLTLGAPGPTGVSAFAVSLDETSSGYVFDTAETIPAPASWSHETWFQTASADGGGLHLWSSSVVYMSDDGTVTFGIYDGSGIESCTTASAYNDGDWHHAAAAYDSTAGTITLYIDGAQAATTTCPTGISGSNDVYIGNGVNIAGGWPGTQDSNFLTGQLCAAAAYDYALSAGQVTAHYDAAFELLITTGSLPYAFPAVAYSATLGGYGGTTPYSWSVSSGSLPGWASLDASTGVISGTPDAPGTTAFTVELTDAADGAVTRELSLTVRPVVFAAAIAGSGAGQYLADQHGDPWLCRGDSVWGLVLNAGVNGGDTTWESDIALYFAVRAGQGFNAAIVDGPCGADIEGIATPGWTWDGVHPWAGDVIGDLNDDWWDRMDLAVSTAASYGITVFLDPADFYALEPGGAMDGITGDQAAAYGAALAARYASAPNIVWLFGNDYNGGSDDIYTSILTALRDGGDAHLVTAENLTEGDSRFAADAGTGWAWGTANAQFNFAYSYCGGYPVIQYSYAEEPPLAVLWGDGWYDAGPYEAGSITVQDSRDYMRTLVWWGLTSGSRGYIYGRGQGDTDLWAWNAGASATLTTNTFDNSDLDSIWNAFAALPGWHALAPDAGGSLVTGGRGDPLALFPSESDYLYTGFTGGSNAGDGQNYYVTASVTPDGTLAVAYLPDATGAQNGGPVTIDESRLPGGYAASWMDPVTGALAGTAPGSSYSTDALNSVGGNDWVLVLQGPPATSPMIAAGIV